MLVATNPTRLARLRLGWTVICSMDAARRTEDEYAFWLPREFLDTRNIARATEEVDGIHESSTKNDTSLS